MVKNYVILKHMCPGYVIKYIFIKIYLYDDFFTFASSAYVIGYVCIS